MADLISRAAAIEGIDAMLRYYDEKTSPLHRRILTDIREGLNEVPAVDAAPVVHGRWIIDTAFGNDVMSNGRIVLCSECGQGSFTGKTNYCSNCGAKMDGERRDGE